MLLHGGVVSMKHVSLPDGEMTPALGLGTWRMGEDASQHDREVATLKAGLDRGLSLIDTAEMYAEGGAELVVADAIAGRRDDAFTSSPRFIRTTPLMMACRQPATGPCERLRTDRLDIYLLHWRGQVPLEETVAGFEKLKQDGKIRHWGVSNLDTRDMNGACRLHQWRQLRHQPAALQSGRTRH
jgi:diketogulonate reductase-like aldo/keto reductase